MPGFVASQIARINQNLGLIALGLAVVSASIAWFGWTYVSAVLLGPRQVSVEELASPRFQSDVNSYKTVIAVQGDAAGPVFYSRRERRGKSGYGTAYCWLVKARDTHLIVESWQASSDPDAVGMLYRVRDEFYRWAVTQFPGQQILPVFIDERDWKSQGWTIFGFAAVFATGALVAAGFLLYWNANPDNHPVRRAVLRLGEFTSNSMQIDGDIEAGSQRFGAVRFGPSMLFYTSMFGFDVVRFDNIASAWTEWRQQGKSRALYLMLETRDGRSPKWQIWNKDSDKLLEAVRAAANLGPEKSQSMLQLDNS